MNASQIPDSQQLKKGVQLPRWMPPIYLTVLFLLIHVIAPWGLSQLSTRYGWLDGRPGWWNWLALILVVVGVVSTFRLIFMHYKASPRSFLELRPGEKLLTPDLYAYSRNPMYVSELTFWFAWALFYGSVAVLIGFLVWFGLFNFAIVPYEEKDLQARFGEAYLQYKKEVPRWLGQRRR